MIQFVSAEGDQLSSHEHNDKDRYSLQLGWIGLTHYPKELHFSLSRKHILILPKEEKNSTLIPFNLIYVNNNFYLLIEFKRF